MVSPSHRVCVVEFLQYEMRRCHVLLLLSSSICTASFTSRDAAPRPPRAGSRRLVPKLAMSLDGMLSTIDNFYRASPYEAAFLTCGFKAACSDSIAQRTEKVSSDARTFSLARNVAFILYGGGYQGCFQYFIFNECYPVVFGTGTDVLTVAIKVIFDQLVLTPFLCLPVAYLVKAVIFRSPLQDTLARYLSDARRDLLWKYWAIWTPAQCLTFSVVPDHLRIAFIALVSFFWLIILSSISNRDATAG